MDLDQILDRGRMSDEDLAYARAGRDNMEIHRRFYERPVQDFLARRWIDLAA
jgi:hypothetical protein